MARGYEFASAEKRNGAARGALKSRAEDVLEDLEELRDDAIKLAEAAKRAASAEVRAAGARVDRFSRTTRARAEGEVRRLSEQVRERPGSALGVAIGLGVLVGLVWSARRR